MPYTAPLSFPLLYQFEIEFAIIHSINLKNDADLEEQNESLASRGYRVIALANGKVEKKNNYKESDIKDFSLARRSIDSRKKDNIFLVYSANIETELNEENLIASFLPNKAFITQKYEYRKLYFANRSLVS